ncbi:MAG: hypothetical protein LBR94_00040 [Desulfovibrio sp.]|nr:hypothetical protein [Desulfovibrio sp.]
MEKNEQIKQRMIYEFHDGLDPLDIANVLQYCKKRLKAIMVNNDDKLKTIPVVIDILEDLSRQLFNAEEHDNKDSSNVGKE